MQCRQRGKPNSSASRSQIDSASTRLQRRTHGFWGDLAPDASMVVQLVLPPLVFNVVGGVSNETVLDLLASEHVVY